MNIIHLPKFILILSSHLRLGLPEGFFPSRFPNKSLYEFLHCSVHTCYLFSRLDLRFIIILDEEYNACSSALCNFVHSPVISSFLAPNIFLSTLYLCINLFAVIYINWFQICCKLKWSGHVAHMDQSINAYRVLVGKPERRRPLGGQGVDRRTILKWIWRRWVVILENE